MIGIDPGTTVGYAFMDLSGKLIHVGSSRGADRQKLITKIRYFGKPALFATDVTPAPEFITKVSATFNARVFEPKKDLGEREKTLLARGFAFENAHERDAIASAVKAFHINQNKFRQIEKVLSSSHMADKTDRIKGMVLEGFSVQDALIDLQAEAEIISAPKAKAILHHEGAVDLVKKNEKIREVLRMNTELKKAIERTESEKKTLQDKLLYLEKGIYERVIRDREIRKRDAKIRRITKSKKETGRKKQQLDLKALAHKKVDIDSIIKNYRRKSSNH
ncbi:MAG: DUF460 domain-containing protein [Candidatus Micrarchaeota archaeon]